MNTKSGRPRENFILEFRNGAHVTKLQLNSGRCVEAIEQRLPVALYFGRWKLRHDHQYMRRR